jgi:hypothetical protein
MMLSHLLQTGPSAPAASPDDRATDFQAVTGDTGEHFNGYTLMVEAYAAIWLILMVWLVFLWRKQAELGARVTGLEAAIARADKKAAAPPKAVSKSADKGKAEKEAVEGM